MAEQGNNFNADDQVIIGKQKKFGIGDRVIMGPLVARAQDAGVVYVVDRILQKNVRVKPEGNPNGPGTRVNPIYLEAAPPKGETPQVGTPVPVTHGPDGSTTLHFAAPLRHAQIVTVAPNPGWTQPAGTLFTVKQVKYDHRGEVAHLYPMGGDERGTYWRVPRAWVEPVDGKVVVLTGLAATFTGDEVETLVRTLAELCGEYGPDDDHDILSLPQRELAQRAWTILQNEYAATDGN